MNILVTGANGQLGNEMRTVSRETDDRYIFSDIVPAEGEETIILDITDPARVAAAVKEHGIRCIVNCAAYTNVDKAESEEALCRRLNAGAPKILAEARKAAGGLLVQISTDYVFGADPYNTPCREDQTGTPTGVYGRTKLEGERNITATGCDHVIIRTAWLYSEFGRNFVKTMRRLGRERGSLGVVFDQAGTPTYAADLAAAVTAMLPEITPGMKEIFHYSNEGVTSWYDFACAIMEMSGISCAVRPIESAEYPTRAARPSFSVLNKAKIKKRFGLAVPHWTDGLKRCVKTMERGE